MCHHDWTTGHSLTVHKNHVQTNLTQHFWFSIIYGTERNSMVYVNLYSAIVANVSNALCSLVPRKQPSFQALFEGSKVLLCAEVVRLYAISLVVFGSTVGGDITLKTELNWDPDLVLRTWSLLLAAADNEERGTNEPSSAAEANTGGLRVPRESNADC